MVFGDVNAHKHKENKLGKSIQTIQCKNTSDMDKEWYTSLMYNKQTVDLYYLLSTLMVVVAFVMC